MTCQPIGPARRRVLASACALLAVLGGVAAAPGHPAPPQEPETTFDEPVRHRVAGPKRANPPNGVVVADLNGDKVPDMAAGLDGTPNVFVMLGDGNGVRNKR